MFSKICCGIDFFIHVLRIHYCVKNHFQIVADDATQYSRCSASIKQYNGRSMQSMEMMEEDFGRRNGLHAARNRLKRAKSELQEENEEEQSHQKKLKQSCRRRHRRWSCPCALRRPQRTTTYHRRCYHQEKRRSRRQMHW